MTGLSVVSVDMAAKRLELLREAVPDFRRLAILFDVGNPVSVEEARQVQAAATSSPLKPFRSQSGAPRTSSPPSKGSRTAPMPFMSAPTRSS